MLKEEVKLVGLLNFKTPIKEVGSEIVHICRYVMYSENTINWGKYKFVNESYYHISNSKIIFIFIVFGYTAVVLLM